MKVELVNYTRNAAKLLCLAKSTRLEMNSDLVKFIDEMSEADIEKELDYMANTIKSNWEFVHYTFLVQGVSRNCLTQVMRTRTNSYSQQTMRVTNQGDYKFSMPDSIVVKPDAEGAVNLLNEFINDVYKSLIEDGIPEEDARAVLPGNIETNVLINMNLRTLSDLVATRTGGRTQAEYRKMMNLIVDEVIAVHPWAKKFLFQKDRDYFKEIEEFAARKFPNLKERGELLKIVDKMRQESK